MSSILWLAYKSGFVCLRYHCTYLASETGVSLLGTIFSGLLACGRRNAELVGKPHECKLNSRSERFSCDASRRLQNVLKYSVLPLSPNFHDFPIADYEMEDYTFRGMIMILQTEGGENFRIKSTIIGTNLGQRSSIHSL